MEKCNCNNKEDVLRIVRGNAFSINIHVEAVRLDGTVVEDFHLIDAEATLRIIHAGNKTEREFIVEENNAIVSFSDGDGCGWYGMEMTGTYNGQPWRWCVENVFQIVETNERANVPSWTFLVDDQYFMTGVLTLISGDRQQADWAETNPNSSAYIKNKPTKLADFDQDPTHRVVTDQQIAAWNAKYDKPSGGIPKSDLAQSVQESLDDADTAYQKPSGGIPKSDLDSSVQTSLGKADTAIQDVTQIENDIDNIEKLIPQQATEQNQLADKQFVNSSISTATATYRGAYNLVSDLELTTAATEQQIAAALATKMAALSIEPDNNDYCFVQIPTADDKPTEIARVDRYKYNGTAWAFEFALNNSGFTAAQWAALNSGITSGLVTKLSDLPTNSELTTLLNGKQDTISDLSDIRSGAAAGATAYQKPSGGIPKSDLDSSVQTSLGKADTAIQDVTQIENDIDNIEKLIPQQATEQNQLADKQFVNSSIATATATYRGAYNLVSDLELTTAATEQQIAAALTTKMTALGITPDNNDYCFVQVPTADATPTEIARVDRYKFNGTAWAFEFSLNNSGFTAAQWAALNSGITSGLVTKLSDLPTNSELTTLLEGKQNTISDLSDIRSGAAAGATAYQKPSGGIPKSDLAQGVQNSLSRADEAVVADGSGTIGQVLTSKGSGQEPGWQTGELVHPVTNVSGTEAVTTSGHYYSVRWIGQCEGVTALRDGMMVNIKIPVQGNSTYHTVLNINGLGEHPVCRNVTNEADAYVADSIITLIYDANAQAPAYFDSGTATTVTGVWKIGDYDSVNIYQLRHNNGSYIAATALPANVICLQKNETTLLPVNTVGTVGTSKVLTTESFNPFGQIVYVNESRSAGEEISPSKIYEQYQIDLRLSFNTGTSLTNYKDVYICAVPQSDGLAKLDPTTPIVQELPSTEDGKIYIYLGHSYSAARVEIYPVHPVYWFKGGKVVPYTVLDISAKADKSYVDDKIGNLGSTDPVYYTQAEADAYNAELDGALNSTDALTAEQAAAYNAAVTGASKEAGDTLSEAEANAYNATLEGAVSTSDVKIPSAPKSVKQYVDDGLSSKQDTLTFDNTPTENSNNPVKSGGIYASQAVLDARIAALEKLHEDGADYIYIDETIEDPMTRVYGHVNGPVIQWIRKNSHRYLGKRTADGVMTVCQLDDANSNLYAEDGSAAVLTGAEGDVFMWLPEFYTETVEVGTKLWRIGFSKKSLGTGWHKWKNDNLVGVYEASVAADKEGNPGGSNDGDGILRSVSGTASQGSVSQANFKTKARNKGTGYSLVLWRQHCIMAVLYYAEYGNTNCQGSIGSGTNKNNKVPGQTDALGMTDTVNGGNGSSGSINFWGLENWWGNKAEWVDNVEVNPLDANDEPMIGVWRITEDDGTTTDVQGSTDPLDTNVYAQNLVYGDNLHIIARGNQVAGTSSTNYCDSIYTGSAGSRVVRRSFVISSANGGVACAYAYIGSSSTHTSDGSRLAFHGQIVKAESVAAFKAAPDYVGTIDSPAEENNE